MAAKFDPQYDKDERLQAQQAAKKAVDGYSFLYGDDWEDASAKDRQVRPDPAAMRRVFGWPKPGP